MIAPAYDGESSDLGEKMRYPPTVMFCAEAKITVFADDERPLVADPQIASAASDAATSTNRSCFITPLPCLWPLATDRYPGEVWQPGIAQEKWKDTDGAPIDRTVEWPMSPSKLGICRVPHTTVEDGRETQQTG